MSENTTRRRFLKIGSSMVLVTSASPTNAKVLFKRSSPASKELIEVGIIMGIGGHSDAIWGRLLNPPEGQMRRTGMVFTKVWSVDRETAELFNHHYGAEIVDNFDDMVGKVHGVFVDDLDAVAYNHKLAQPYLEAGIPTFVNRPFTDSMHKAHDMVERSRKNDAPLMTASSWEHLVEVNSVKRLIDQQDITGYEAWNSCGGADFYSHGLHGLWWAYATVGGGIHAVSHQTENWRATCGGVTHVVYKDRGKGPFIGKINEGQMPDEPSHGCAINIQPGNLKILKYGGGGSWGGDYFQWLPMIQRVQWMFETGGMYQTHEEILEKTAMFISAFYSILELDGKMVEIDTLPGDWAIGSPYRGYIKKERDMIDLYAQYFGREKGKLIPVPITGPPQ